MKYLKLAFVGVGVILAILFSVQIVDPNLADDKQADVDFTAPPEDVIRSSIQHTSKQSFTYEMLLSETEHPDPNETEFFMRVEVEESAREYSSVGPLGYEHTYGNDAAMWKKLGKNRSWSIHPFEHTTFKPILAKPFRNLEPQNGRITIVEETDSTIVYRVNNTSLISYRGSEFFATITIDKETGYAVAVTSGPANSSIPAKFVHIRLYDLGETSVSRPDDLGFSIQELFWDLIRGPVSPIE